MLVTVSSHLDLVHFLRVFVAAAFFADNRHRGNSLDRCSDLGPDVHILAIAAPEYH